MDDSKPLDPHTLDVVDQLRANMATPQAVKRAKSVKTANPAIQAKVEALITLQRLVLELGNLLTELTVGDLVPEKISYEKYSILQDLMNDAPLALEAVRRSNNEISTPKLGVGTVFHLGELQLEVMKILPRGRLILKAK